MPPIPAPEAPEVIPGWQIILSPTQRIVIPRSHVIFPPTEQDPAPPAHHGPLLPAQGDVFPPTEQDVLPPTEQNVLPPTDHNVVPPTEHDVLPSTEQGVLPPTEQGGLPPTEQRVVPYTQQGVTPSTQQGVLPPTQQGVLHPTQQALLPPTRRVLVPSPRRVLVPSTRRVPVPSTRRVLVPSTRRVLVPSTRRVLVPSSRRGLVPVTQQNHQSHPQPILPNGNQLPRVRRMPGHTAPLLANLTIRPDGQASSQLETAPSAPTAPENEATSHGAQSLVPAAPEDDRPPTAPENPDPHIPTSRRPREAIPQLLNPLEEGNGQLPMPQVRNDPDLPNEPPDNDRDLPNQQHIFNLRPNLPNDPGYQLQTTWKIMLPPMPRLADGQNRSAQLPRTGRVPKPSQARGKGPAGKNAQEPQNRQINIAQRISRDIDQLITSTSGDGVQLPTSTTDGDSELPSTSKENSQSPSSSNASDSQVSSTSSDDPQFPSSTSEHDSHLPTSSGDDVQLPLKIRGDPQLPTSTSRDDPQLPTSRNERDARWPDAHEGDILRKHNGRRKRAGQGYRLSPNWDIFHPQGHSVQQPLMWPQIPQIPVSEDQTSQLPQSEQTNLAERVHLPNAPVCDYSQASSSTSMDAYKLANQHADEDSRLPTSSEIGDPQLLSLAVEDNPQVSSSGCDGQLPSHSAAENVRQPPTWYIPPTPKSEGGPNMLSSHIDQPLEGPIVRPNGEILAKASGEQAQNVHSQSVGTSQLPTTPSTCTTNYPYFPVSSEDDDRQLPTSSRDDHSQLPTSSEHYDPLVPTSTERNVPQLQKECGPQLPTHPEVENYPLFWYLPCPLVQVPDGQSSSSVNECNPVLPTPQWGDGHEVPCSTRNGSAHMSGIPGGLQDDPYLASKATDDNSQLPNSSVENDPSIGPNNPNVTNELPMWIKVDTQQHPVYWYLPPGDCDVAVNYGENQREDDSYSSTLSVGENSVSASLPQDTVTPLIDGKDAMVQTSDDEEEGEASLTQGDDQSASATDDDPQVPTSTTGDAPGLLCQSNPMLPTPPVLQNNQIPPMWQINFHPTALLPTFPNGNIQQVPPTWQVGFPPGPVPSTSAGCDPQAASVRGDDYMSPALPEDTVITDLVDGKDAAVQTLPEDEEEEDPTCLETDNPLPTSAQDESQLPTSTSDDSSQPPKGNDPVLPTPPVLQNIQQPFMWRENVYPPLENLPNTTIQQLPTLWQIICPPLPVGVTLPGEDCVQVPTLTVDDDPQSPSLPEETGLTPLIDGKDAMVQTSDDEGEEYGDQLSPNSADDDESQFPTSTSGDEPCSQRPSDPVLPTPPLVQNQQDPLMWGVNYQPPIATTPNNDTSYVQSLWRIMLPTVLMPPTTSGGDNSQVPTTSGGDDPLAPSLPEDTVLRTLTDGGDAMVQTLSEDEQEEEIPSLSEEDEPAQDVDPQLPTSTTEDGPQLSTQSNPVLPTPPEGQNNQAQLMWRINLQPATLFSTLPDGNIQQIPSMWQIFYPQVAVPSMSTADNPQEPTSTVGAEGSQIEESPSQPGETVLTLIDGKDAMVQTSDDEEGEYYNELLSTCDEDSEEDDSQVARPPSREEPRLPRLVNPVMPIPRTVQNTRMPIMWQMNSNPPSTTLPNSTIERVRPIWRVCPPAQPTALGVEPPQIPTTSRGVDVQAPSSSRGDNRQVPSTSKAGDSLSPSQSRDGEEEENATSQGDYPLLPASADGGEPQLPIVAEGNGAPLQQLPERPNPGLPNQQMLGAPARGMGLMQNLPRRGVLVAPHLPAEGGQALPNAPGGFPVLPNFPGGGVPILNNLPDGGGAGLPGDQQPQNGQGAAPGQLLPLVRPPLRTVIDMFTRRSPLWNGTQEYEEVLQYIITTNLFE